MLAYIVKMGEWPNDRIIGVTLDKERADRYVENVRLVSDQWEEQAAIEEYEIDDFGDGTEWHRVYTCVVEICSGKIVFEHSDRTTGGAKAPVILSGNIHVQSLVSADHAREMVGALILELTQSRDQNRSQEVKEG